MRTLEDAVQELKRNPGHPIRASLESLTVEVRVVPSIEADRSAAELFAEIGPWQGESTAEILVFLSRARQHSSGA